MAPGRITRMKGFSNHRFYRLKMRPQYHWRPVGTTLCSRSMTSLWSTWWLFARPTFTIVQQTTHASHARTWQNPTESNQLSVYCAKTCPMKGARWWRSSITCCALSISESRMSWWSLPSRLGLWYRSASAYATYSSTRRVGGISSEDCQVRHTGWQLILSRIRVRSSKRK